MIIPADIPAALEKLGVSEYKIHGHELTARCPSGNHPDRHPSWSVNTTNGLNGCFSCGYKGNFIHLVQCIRGCNYDQAASWVLSLPLRKIEIPDKPAEVQQPLISLEGMTLPPDNLLREKNITPEAAQKYELLWDGENWIATMRDPRTLRLMGWQEKNGTAKRFRNFPDNIEKSSTLFGIQAVTLDGTVGVVESPDDAAGFESAGIGNFVASYGVHLSAKQLGILKRAKRLVLALDNDNDGLQETARIFREIGGAVPIRVFSYGDSRGIDPGKLTAAEKIAGYENSISGLLWRNGNQKWRKRANRYA